MTKVSKIMNTNVPTLGKDANVSDVVGIIAKNSYGCVIIVENKKPIGIITESDIIRNFALKKNSQREKATKIMSSPVTTIDVNARLDKANKIMGARHFRKYPVVENGNLVGLLTENSVVHAISQNVRFHRNVQNAVLMIFMAFEFFIFFFYRHLAKFLTFLR
ncbi:CBS domain-containing protein [Candidatus Woesearchaeota archaeon]|nr:CBS domain-containing protein [Candidatus Woesearchaeota archaeon]